MFSIATLKIWTKSIDWATSRSFTWSLQVIYKKQSGILWVTAKATMTWKSSTSLTMTLLWLKFHYCNRQYQYFLSLQEVNNIWKEKALQNHTCPLFFQPIYVLRILGSIAVFCLRGSFYVELIIKKYEISWTLVTKIRIRCSPQEATTTTFKRWQQQCV